MAKTLLGYRFLTRDPMIDVYRTAREQSGKSIEDVARVSGITVQTLKRWEFGDTRKPQHVTMRFAMDACGFQEEWVDQRTGATLSASYAKPNRPRSRK